MIGNVTREQIMNALLAQLQTGCGSTFATYSRRFQMYDELIQQITAGRAPTFPALYLYDGVGFGGGIDHWDQGKQSVAGPVKRTLMRTVVIYAIKPGSNTPDGTDMTSIGASYMNPLIESVENVIEQDDNLSFGTNTLGGLVRHCWVEGDGLLIPGDIDQTGLAMQTIPVKILIP